MAAIGRSARVARVFGILLMAVSIAGAAAFSLRTPTAAAEEGDLDALKAHWQSKCRKLRVEEARLVETVKLATKEYADSNRRTYRRSGVRHFHRTNANEAKAELKLVRAQIESTFSDVVAAGGSVNWLYDVDEEMLEPNRIEGLGVYRDDGRFGGKGAYVPGSDGDGGADVPASDDEDDGDGDADGGAALEPSDDGRNPLYSEDDPTKEDDDPASIDEGGFGPYDYEYWRTNRQEYEGERAPERHLSGDDY
jgi:hypothetical protein